MSTTELFNTPEILAAIAEPEISSEEDEICETFKECALNEELELYMKENTELKDKVAKLKCTCLDMVVDLKKKKAKVEELLADLSRMSELAKVTEELLVKKDRIIANQKKQIDEKYERKSREIMKQGGQKVTEYVVGRHFRKCKMLVRDTKEALAIRGEPKCFRESIFIDSNTHEDKFLIWSYSDFALDFMEQRIKALMVEGVNLYCPPGF